MRVRRILLVRRAVADVAVDDDQRRPVVGLQERLVGAAEHRQIVGIGDARDVPAVARHTSSSTSSSNDHFAGPFDRDAVVVVDPAEIRKLEMSGERCGFVADAFHHVAVAAQRVTR